MPKVLEKNEKIDILDEFLKDKEIKDMDSFDEMFKELKKSIIERMLSSEMTYHLGYPKHAKAPSTNRRNGTSSKTIKTDTDEICLDIPRDRESTFEPRIMD